MAGEDIVWQGNGTYRTNRTDKTFVEGNGRGSTRGRPAEWDTVKAADGAQGTARPTLSVAASCPSVNMRPLYNGCGNSLVLHYLYFKGGVIGDADGNAT